MNKMTKEQAIKWIKDIQHEGFDRYENIDQIPRGSIAINKWNDATFTFGMEYGAIAVLIKIYNIKKEEL